MNVTRDVIRDLLPLYHAGEASADTIELVDVFLQGDPELAQESKKMESLPLDSGSAELPADHEIRTLERTRGLIRARSWIMGIAIFFTLLPLSGAYIGDNVDWTMLRDAPVLAGVSFLVGIIAWIAYYAVHRRVRIALT